jgi:hypothetical protein
VPYIHPDGCVGCQSLRNTRAYHFSWQVPFTMKLCLWCFLGLLLARPLYLLRR